MSMKRNTRDLLYSTVGVVAMVVILVAVNFIVGAFNARVDLTQGSAYTLSAGTKAILGKLDTPVKIRFYCTQGDERGAGRVSKTYASAWRICWREYQPASNGKVIIEKLDPEPDSDAEDSARLDGIEGQLRNTGEKFYLGLAVSFLDQKAAMPFLAPDRERLLEYDLARAITRVATPTKPVVGVMTRCRCSGCRPTR